MKAEQSLERLGWNEFFAQHCAAYQAEETKEWQVARVIAEHRGAWRVNTGEEDLMAGCTGRMRHHSYLRSDLPAVGDWVALKRDATDGRPVIQSVFPRKSKFSRKGAGDVTQEQLVAANVDTLFLLNALNLDFNPRRLERYLVLAWDSGARPVVVLTKSDLCEGVDDLLEELESVAFGVPIHAVSAVTGDGLEALDPYLQPGQTVALLGSSGVGKSTLLNCLSGWDRQKVLHIREHDHRGQHTTTARELFVLPSGALMIDTPGMRELQMWNNEDGFQQAFDDLESLATQCKFRDCTHKNEPGCALLGAIENGTLEPHRLQNYHKLQREMAYLNRKQNQRAQLDERKKWKQITVQNRHKTPIY